MEASDLVIVVEHLIGCARCHGEGHDNVQFEKLTYPVEIQAGAPNVTDVKLTHWATCPDTGEPILMAWVDIETGGRAG